MVTEAYVSFELAKLLKEKGFDEATIGYYYSISEIPEKIKFFDSPISVYHSDGLIGCIQAPTLQMAMKWLRKEHQIGIFPRQYHIYKDNAVSDEFGYGVEIIKLGTDIPLNPNGEKISDKDRYFISTSYEQACEAAIKYSLENLI